MIDASEETTSRSHHDHSEDVVGAHSTHRPEAFPDAARSKMLGCEHVTACTAVILINN